MIFIPAIDLKGGRCVRLSQGDEKREKVYYQDPLEVGRIFKEKGVSLVHVVDLDGAMKGKQENKKVVEALVNMGLKVQLGGGIRSYEVARSWIELGVDRVVVSTMFFKNPGEFLRTTRALGDRIWVGIDVKDGVLAIKGWKEKVPMDPVEAARRAEELGAGGIIYTDISRDGMEVGPDFEGGKRIMDAVSIPVILSGGVKDLEDLVKAKNMGFYGVISGRALYEGRFSLEEALRVSR